jgi:predicted negative regulator of RcsB-dependent stress response
MEAYEESEKYLKKAVDLEVNGTLLEHYGDVLFKLGREKEALEQWHKAKELGGATDLIESKIEAQKEDD